MSALSKNKIIVEITTEPITLNEVKAHLRINNFSDDSNEVENIFSSKEYAIGTHEGTGINVLNKTSKININAGEFSGSAIFTIQESDDNINFYDWYNFDEISASNDNTIHSYDYTGTKQYIRVKVIVSDDVCVFAVNVSSNNFDDEDSVLNNYIKSAREFGEDFTGAAFATQTIDKYLDDFPNDDLINWDYNPLQSITHFKYTDSTGDVTTLTEDTDYSVDTIEGFIYTPPNVYFPTSQLWSRNAIVIRGICGFADGEIPKQFKHAMLLHIGLMYKYRDEKIPVEDLNTVYRFYNMRRKRWF